MPAIQFDVLIPAVPAEQLRGTFTTALDKLVDAGRLTAGEVTVVAGPTLREGVEEALRQSYRDEHEDADLADATVVRYLIAVEGATGSINQLTMVLSRFMTPQADLPRDAVVLENEAAHEVPATYPWSVDILR